MRSLAVLVTVTAPVFDALAAGAEVAPARERIEGELAELLAELGVEARPELHFASTSDPMRGQPLRVHVDGRLCLLPARSAAEALAYAIGSSQVRASLTGVELLDGVSPAQRHETLAEVVRAAVTAQPEVVVTEDDPLAGLLGAGLSLVGEDPESLRDDVRSGGVDALLDRLTSPTFDLHVEPAYAQALTTAKDGAELFEFLRDGLLVELGVLLPPMHLRLDPALRSRGFAFRVNGLRTIPRIGLALDAILVNDSPEHLERRLAVPAVPSVNPATGQAGSIAPAVHRSAVEASGLTVWDPFGFYILTMAQVLRTRAAALMSPAQVRRAMDALGQAYPAVTETFDDTAVEGVVGPLLRSLLAEQISTRNLRHVLQLVRRHVVAPELCFGEDLHTFVRRGLTDQIAHAATRGTDTLVAYLIDAELEGEVAEHAERSQPVPVALAEDLRNAFYRQISDLPVDAAVPAVLTSEKCRAAVRGVLVAEYPATRVLDYRDLPSSCDVQPLARISR